MNGLFIAGALALGSCVILVLTGGSLAPEKRRLICWTIGSVTSVSSAFLYLALCRPRFYVDGELIAQGGIMAGCAAVLFVIAAVLSPSGLLLPLFFRHQPVENLSVNKAEERYSLFSAIVTGFLWGLAAISALILALAPDTISDGFLAVLGVTLTISSAISVRETLFRLYIVRAMADIGEEEENKARARRKALRALRHRTGRL